ncbi:MAG: acyltransferase [Gemmataceae bacterium]|nr:acyltransferase [Gemmataceae bacterium]
MTPSSGTYDPRLDHLRFAAAFLVLCCHALPRFVPAEVLPFPFGILPHGATGVSLFLVLSGFVFMKLCRGKEVEYRGFLRNRALRIAPMFLLYLSLAVWLKPGLDMGQLLAALATLTDPARIMPGVSWTILVEVQFYLLFPFLLVFHRKHGLRWLLTLAAVPLVLRLLAHSAHGTAYRLAERSLVGRLDQFLIGMIACEAWHARPGWFRRWWMLPAAVLGWLLLAQAFAAQGGYPRGYPEAVGGLSHRSRLWAVLPALEGVAYGLLIACWMGCPWRLPRWLDDGLAWLGKLSFSFYLNHMLVMNACLGEWRKAGLPTDGFGAGMAFTVLAALPAAVAVSALTYHAVEEPFLSLRGKYLREPEAAPARLAGTAVAA